MDEQEKSIKSKLELLKLAEKIGNVSEACKQMGYSRDSFYRFKNLYENGGELALQDISKRKPNIKNRVPEKVEKEIINWAYEQPSYGQLRVSNELKKKGIDVSPGGVRTVWLRYDLETFHKRLRALKTKSVQEKFLLTEEQQKVIEKINDFEDTKLQIESPGSIGFQDNFYIGEVKGIGKVYQHTFMDSYSKFVFVKLYDKKDDTTTADFLNQKVIPFFKKHNVPIQKIVTDKKTEYYSKKQNKYQSLLNTKKIELVKNKIPLIKEELQFGFHKIMQDEFYSALFRKKVYKKIQELQKDVDEWVKNYNEQKGHPARYCYGKTPLKTFTDSKSILKKKSGKK